MVWSECLEGVWSMSEDLWMPSRACGKAFCMVWRGSLEGVGRLAGGFGDAILRM